MEKTQILLRPVLTEKTSREEAKGLYTFIVAQGASKIDIKNAVRALYGVNAHSVTVRPTPKKVRIVGRGREITKRDHVKKATINFGPGVKLDLYKFSKVEGKVAPKKVEKATTKTSKKPKAEKEKVAAATA